MKKQLKQPSPLAKANNQIHILQTTNQELQDKLATAQLTIERKDRMFNEELIRSQKMAATIKQVKEELTGIKSKWYYSLFKNW